MERATLPSSISKWAATRPIMPKRRRGVLHGSGAMLLNENGNGRLQKRPNYLLTSGNVRHVDASLSHTKLLRSTSALSQF